MPIYDDTTEEAISPNHLLFGRKVNINKHESRTNLCTIEPSKRFKYLEKLLSHFWER